MVSSLSERERELWQYAQYFLQLLHVCLALDTLLDSLKSINSLELLSEPKIAIKNSTNKDLSLLHANAGVNKDFFFLLATS